MYSIRLGDPEGFTIVPAVAEVNNALLISAGELFGLFWSRRAMAPDTCGAAIEVPLRVAVEKSLSGHAEVMSTPGAKISTQEPKLEKSARLSLESVAPTVMAVGTRPPGE